MSQAYTSITASIYYLRNSWARNLTKWIPLEFQSSDKREQDNGHNVSGVLS